MNTPLKIGVFMGGSSHEKETSLDSGRNIVYKLSPQRYSAIPIFVTTTLELYQIQSALLVCNSTKEIEQALPHAQQTGKARKITWDELPTVIDFAFIALHGGIGENGALQGVCEMLNIPYNGSSILSSALCMDKYQTTFLLRNQGFAVPDALLLAKTEWQGHNQNQNTSRLEQFLKEQTYPLIVKPHDDGCSVMVQKACNYQELCAAIEHIFSQDKQYAMIEECIQGMELTVGVVGNNKARALPPSQAIANNAILTIEEKFLPGAGENQTPAPLPAETLRFVQHTVEQVYKVVGCKGYARIDCFYQSAQQSPTNTERVIIIEINTLPGMTPATCIFHQAAEIGLKPTDFIDLIVQLGLQEHAHMVAHKAYHLPTQWINTLSLT